MPLKSININAPEACSIESLPDDWVMISINEEHGPLYPLKLDRNLSSILTVRFCDTVRDEERDGQMCHPITKETTLGMLEFIERNKDKNFIIHCAAGISRSGATALFIHKRYGHELKPNFYQVSRPNNYVLYMLQTAGNYDGINVPIE